MTDSKSDESSASKPEAASTPSSTVASRWSAFLHRAKGTVTAVAAVGAVLSGLVGYWTTYRSVAPTPVPASAAAATTAAAPLSILVLPFLNQTGDERQAYVADGLTMSITSDLTRIRDVFVVPVATAFTYKNKALTVQQIGKDSAVRFVLQGSVMASGENLRIGVQLADAKSGAQLWSETFAGSLGDLFTLQDAVTARVGNSIGERMVIVAARESEKRKSSSEVADLTMRARALQFKPQSPQRFAEGEALYRKALAREPDNLDAMTGLASVLAMHAVWLDDSNPARERYFRESEHLALEVKASDPSIFRIYLPLAINAMQHNDFDGARRHYEALVQYDPKNPAGYNNLALYWREMGEPQKSLPLLKSALTLYPKGDEMVFANLGGAYLALGDNDAAIEWLSKSADLDVRLPDVYAQLAMAYSNKGDRNGAARYGAEYRKRAEAAGMKAQIDAYPLPPGQPAAYVTYYHDKYIPEWKKAGLP